MVRQITKVSRIVVAGLMLAGAASADVVALGSDYLYTNPTSFFNFGGGIGTVHFTGLPNAAGGSDTIVQRLQDTTINSGLAPLGQTASQIAALSNATNIQITDLSLHATAPVNIGGSFFDVFATLDPANLGNDTGKIVIYGSATGGTFDSELNVFFDAHFVPLSTGTAFDVFSGFTLVQNGGVWSPTRPANAPIVNGVDEGAGDQAANVHSGLDSAIPEVDFFLGVVGFPVPPSPYAPPNSHVGDFVPTLECDPTHGCHDPQVVPNVPEPGSIFLLGTGIASLFVIARKRRLQG